LASPMIFKHSLLRHVWNLCIWTWNFSTVPTNTTNLSVETTTTAIPFNEVNYLGYEIC
jgi:hypothetical protein